MNLEQRNELVVRYIPVVKRIVRAMRLDPSIQDDCIQAGNISVIKQIDAWAAAHPAEDFDSQPHGMIAKSIRRDVLREKTRLESCGHVDIDSMLEANVADVVEDFEENFHPTDAVLPAVNDGNVDLDREIMTDRMLDVIRRQKGPSRTIGLGVLAGFTVTEVAEKIGLTQSAGDRLYQKLVTILREELAGG